MKSTIINIGDELLIGQVVNTNAAQMSQMLIAAGFDVTGVFTIADNGREIDSYLRHCLEISDVVLMTGGLGPTKDDITKKVLCDFFHSELYENEVALENVRRLMAMRGKELTEINRQQSWVPRCCTMINNVVGTAPCMWFEVDGTAPSKVVVSLPGVPFEMENLMQTEVVPRLQKHFQTDFIIHKKLLIHGIGESFLSDLIEEWELALPKTIRLAYLPQAGLLKLRLTARGSDEVLLQHQLDEAVRTLYSIAGEYIMGEDFESLPELVAHLLREKGIALATAESCTGGSIASKLTAMAGASDYYLGGVVSYSNEVKEKVLGVKHSTLETFGAVSEETAFEMALGAQERLGADMAVATTGIAGPGGGSPEKPVGTVCFGLAYNGQVLTKKVKLPGRRAQVIERACNEAYAWIAKQLTINNRQSNS